MDILVKRGLWRHLTNFWTLTSFLIVLENFRLEGEIAHLLGPVLSIYIASLAVFSAEKEFERWNWREKRRHLGEIYVWAWTLVIIFMLFSVYASGSKYRIEPEIFSTYIVVLGILAVTRKSKQLFNQKSH